MGLAVSDAVRLLPTRIANATTVTAIMQAHAGTLPKANSIEELKTALGADD